MKKLLLMAALVAVITFGSGCAGLAGVAQQLKDDPAVVVVDVNSPWGKQTFMRVGGTSNLVTIKDGAVSISPPPK